jgi:hypothetical protein
MSRGIAVRQFGLALAAGLLLAACGPSAPKTAGAPPDMRRLTDEQYHNVLVDVFGANIDVGARFDPLLRSEGLAAISARTARITPNGFERYYVTARQVASRVVDAAHRETLIPCQPASAAAADDACARSFLSATGRMLFRRPLTQGELDYFVSAARDGAATNRDFYRGLGASLAAMLVTPQFLFVADATEPDPAHPGRQRLTAFAKASRLSFLLWNTTPDDALLTAAEKGALHDPAELARQVDRMMAAPKLDTGVRAFFADFLDFQKFETLEKDPVIYPTFTSAVAEDAKEQILRTVVDALLVRNDDYRTIFTTRHTFLNRSLGRVYRVRVDRTDDAWVPYDFAPEDLRAGIQSQIGMLALYAHPGRSSPTLRGRAVRELLLCQKVPDPPGNVDFSLFNDPNSPNKTARDRLTAHRTAPTCEGCHKVTDPVGLGFEVFDGAGQFRTTENDAKIDTAGELDGIAYRDPADLGKAIAANPAAPACVANRLYSYAVGRAPGRDEGEFLKYLERSFAGDGYRFRNLLRRIALSDAFFAISTAVPAQGDAAEPKRETKS